MEGFANENGPRQIGVYFGVSLGTRLGTLSDTLLPRLCGAEAEKGGGSSGVQVHKYRVIFFPRSERVQGILRGPHQNLPCSATLFSLVAFCSPAKSLTFSGLMENPFVGKKLKS